MPSIGGMAIVVNSTPRRLNLLSFNVVLACMQLTWTDISPYVRAVDRQLDTGTRDGKKQISAIFLSPYSHGWFETPFRSPP